MTDTTQSPNLSRRDFLKVAWMFLGGVAALETAGGIKSDRGNPKFLVLISVSHGGAEAQNSFEFDNRKYIEFE